MAKTQPSAWAGWVYFAGSMMILLGGLQAVTGLAALFKDEYFLVTKNNLLVLDFTTWGWVHLALGLFILLAGYAVLTGKTWGRIVGTVLAVFSAMVNLAFLSAYPIWSIIAITIDVLVIYALTMYSEEVN